ncbi:hypothetical protein MOKP106_40910 [Mycobacterium avium subsp. hominissuis]
MPAAEADDSAHLLRSSATAEGVCEAIGDIVRGMPRIEIRLKRQAVRSVVELIEQHGMGLAQACEVVGRQHGINENTLRRLVAEAGYRRYTPISDELKKRAVEAVNQMVESEGSGVSRACREVGEQLGVNQNTLRKLVSEFRRVNPTE